MKSSDVRKFDEIVIIDKKETIEKLIGFVPTNVTIIEPFFATSQELVALLIFAVFYDIEKRKLILFPWILKNVDYAKSFVKICELVERANLNAIIVNPMLAMKKCPFPNINVLKNVANEIAKKKGHFHPENEIACDVEQTLSECILSLALD